MWFIFYKIFTIHRLHVTSTATPRTCQSDPMLYFPYDHHYDDVSCTHASATVYGDHNGAKLETDGANKYVCLGGNTHFEVSNRIYDIESQHRSIFSHYVITWLQSFWSICYNYISASIISVYSRFYCQYSKITNNGNDILNMRYIGVYIIIY